MAMREGELIYFYELHENDDELYSDVLLAHDAEFDEDEFLTMVLEAREAVTGHFEEDTLSESIARELQRRHGFIVVDDAQLRVAVTVSAEEGATIVAVDERPTGAQANDGFRSLVLDSDSEDRLWGDDAERT